MFAAFRPVWGGLGFAVLVLAALNVAFRIGHETVQVWDEALYGLSAQEVLSSGDWIRTTIQGRVDYYNAKPPLNVWLIALSFKTFGVSLTALRLPSIVAAWSTIALLLWWLRRSVGDATAILSALVLATSYGFLYVHSGREANTDAIFVLLFLLMAITVWAARSHPWRRLWLGPLFASVFLLRGMAIALPLLFVAMVEVATPRSQRTRWIPLSAAVAVFVVLITPWAIARWQVDGWTFFEQMFFQDFIARTTTPLDGHQGSVLFYLHALQKNHYDWLIAAVVAWLCAGWRLPRFRAIKATWSSQPMVVLLSSWAITTLFVPTVTATKAAWYLNSFYPVFAVGVAWAIATAWQLTQQSHPRRAAMVVIAAALAFFVAESKLIRHSYADRGIEESKQGVILAHADDIRGHVVYAESWDLADFFVLRAVGGRAGTAPNANAFIAANRDEDFWLGALPDVSVRGARVSPILFHEEGSALALEGERAVAILNRRIALLRVTR